MQIDGVRVLVTGGGSGLGEAAARGFHAAGATVVVVDRDGDAADRVAKDLGVRALAVAADAASEEDMTAAVATGRDRAPLRAVVACAGGGSAPARTLDRAGAPHSLDVFERTVRNNLVTAFNTVRLAAAEMATLDPVDDDGQRGAIVVTASIAGYEGQIGQVAYGSAKAGIIGMTLITARDLAAVGVRVNCIAPGLLNTPAWGPAESDFKTAFAKTVPFPKRFGAPPEFAAAARHLVENDYVNGHVLRLDGAIRFGPR